MNTPLEEMDNIDDRKQLLILLEHLTPAQRCQFVEWCIKTFNGFKEFEDSDERVVQVTNPTGEIAEIFGTLLSLVHQFEMPIQVILESLERAVSEATKKTQHKDNPSKNLILPFISKNEKENQ